MVTMTNVTKRFRKRVALNNISLELDKGCYGLLGPNGAGKTTLLRCLLDLYSPTSGNITIHTGNIGYLPQKFGAFRELSVYDMLCYFAALKKIPKSCRKSEIQKVLSLVNLEERRKERISRLSGGMQRRVGIAQAVLGDPDIIFFDEPTAGLDPEERVRFKSMIAGIMKDRLILISTHIVEDVESVCDRVLIMDKGKLLANATVEETCSFAENKVYEFESNDKHIREPFFLEKTIEREGVLYWRILSDQEQDGGIWKAPTLEDGYIARIQGML